MTSKPKLEHREAYVWVWLPGETSPVLAGKIVAANGQMNFGYSKRYLARASEQPKAIALYEPELPLKAGIQAPKDGFTIASSLRDAAPDAWGRRVILNKLLGRKGHHADTAEIDELTYLLESGSDRIGALDFQISGTEYVPRNHQNASIEQLAEAAERVERGDSLHPDLSLALCHGSSIGGARPKALVQNGGKKYVAKFSSSSDTYSILKAEFIAMKLAAQAGLQVAPVKLMKIAGKDLLLVERFDRIRQPGGWSRRCMVSAFTVLGLDEMMARYASYEAFADTIRHRSADPSVELKELFTRLVFNVLCGNTDDHARNHAAFWDGQALALTPAYDICPQPRVGREASQAMLIHDSVRSSTLASCLVAAERFLLTESEARAIFSQVIQAIEQNWESLCDQAELGDAERTMLWRRQFLNPSALGSVV